MLGQILLGDGKYFKPPRHFRQTLYMDPASARSQQALAYCLTQLGKESASKGRMEQALRQLGEAIAWWDKDVEALGTMALILAASPDARFRRWPRAVALAERAVQLTNAQHPVYLDTLAMARARAGDWPGAVRDANAALALAEANDMTALAEMIRQRIQLYQAHQPFTIQ